MSAVGWNLVFAFIALCFAWLSVVLNYRSEALRWKQKYFELRYDHMKLLSKKEKDHE